ncbi:hypothetical protein [uncultured Pseudokineococcus sp.]|uniref:hypothetical protein n=1 Tax=uncultured Pseudokineococcus sp. TaxID=1642928 RepID=UPI00261C0DDC|nr:hypothetical protein [uncultured Pseudokineococcus sp.]
MPDPTRASRSPRHGSRLRALLRRGPAPRPEEPADERPGAAPAPPAPPAAARPVAPPEPETPRAPVADVVATWSRALARTGGRGVLVDDRTAADVLVPPLDLGGAHPSGLAAFWAGRPTRLSSLFRERGSHEGARERVRALRASAQEVADQHGVPACALAVGLVRWSAPAAGRATAAEVHAPALLQRLVLQPRGTGVLDEELDLRPEVRVNPELVDALARRGHGLDAGAVLAPFEDGRGDPHRRALRALGEQLADVPGLELAERTLVGVYPELAGPLAADAEHLAARPDERVGPLVAGLAAVTAGAAVDRPAGPPPAAPGWGDVARWRVLDLDEGQAAAHDALAAGRSLRVLAGPGSGATQLAAQAVASAVGAGRRCLVVAPGTGEAHDVLARLAATGLGDLAGEPAARPGAPQPAGDAGDAGDVGAQEGAGPDAAAARLRAGARALDVPAGDGLDAGVLAGAHALVRLARAPRPPRSAVRLDADGVRATAAEGLGRVVGHAREAARLGAFRPELASSPWAGAALGSGEEARVARRRAEELAGTRLPRLAEHLDALGERTGLRRPATAAEVEQRLRLLVDVRGTLEDFSPGVYERPLGELVRALGQDATWRTRRTAQKVVAEVVRPGARPADLRTSLRRADAERRAWSAAAEDGGRPHVPHGIAEAQRALADVVAELDRLEPVLRGTRAGAGLRDADLSSLTGRLWAMADDDDARGDLPARVDVLVRLGELGLGGLVEDLRDRAAAHHHGGPRGADGRRGVDEDDAAAEAELVVRASALAEAGRRGVLDDLRPASAAAAREQLVAGTAARRRREAADLLATAGAVGAVDAASLLALPAVLGPAAQGAVDLVVLLDAHAAGVPEGALALARGAQVLVVGDPAGPPPSSAVVGAPAPEHPGEGAPTSLLAATAGLLEERSLGRSHRLPRQLGPVVAAVRAEALEPATGEPGAASGGTPSGSASTGVESTGSASPDGDPATGWDDAVPAPPGAWPVVLRRVDGRGRASAEGVVHSLDVEVDAVVETAVGHLREDPERSLAVVAVTRGHARRVADALRAAVAADAALAAAVARSARSDEPLVVTDVGRAQGCVRDVVVLSGAFAPTERGRVPGAFGPLDAAGGAAALADAVAGARRRLVVVTCLAAEDLAPDRLRTPGARALRALLVAVEDADERHRAAHPSADGPGTAPGSGAGGGAAEGPAGPSGVVDAAPPDVAPEDLLPPGDDAARALGAHARLAAPTGADADTGAGTGADDGGADPLVAALVERLGEAGAHVRAAERPGDPDLSVRLRDGRCAAVLPDVRPPGPETGPTAADPVRRVAEAAALRRQGWAVAHVASLGLLVDPAREVADVLAAARRPGAGAPR